MQKNTTTLYMIFKQFYGASLYVITHSNITNMNNFKLGQILQPCRVIKKGQIFLLCSRMYKTEQQNKVVTDVFQSDF